MSLSPESFVKETKSHREHATVEKAQEVIGQNISIIADYIKSGSENHLKPFHEHTIKSHSTAHTLLFRLNADPNGIIFSQDDKSLLMEKELLQRTAIEVMKTFGLDENESFITSQSPLHEKRSYPSQTIDRLSFTRFMMKTEEGNLLGVVWDVFDRAQLLPERRIEEPVAI